VFAVPSRNSVARKRKKLARRSSLLRRLGRLDGAVAPFFFSLLPCCARRVAAEPRGVVAEWLGRARAREIGLYSPSRPWCRGGRRGRDQATCRAPGSPRLGFGVAGWLRVRRSLPIALVRSKRGAGGVTMAGRVGEKQRRAPEVGDDWRGPPVSRTGGGLGAPSLAARRAGPRCGGWAVHGAAGCGVGLRGRLGRWRRERGRVRRAGRALLLGR